jgi:homoserine kinase type II
MAVYTSLNKDEIINFLSEFDVGVLKDFQGITAGVENTNYFIHTDKNTFVLTIFEKRVDVKDLPYFISLMNHINNKGINCPYVIPNKNGENINEIVGKKAILISFLEGEDISDNIDKNHTNDVGSVLSSMHNATADFPLHRDNSLGLKGVIDVFENIRDKLSDEYFEVINNEINYQKQNKITGLPVGATHLDLFSDNVFFDLSTNKLSGVIDFYFSADDYYVYDLAITINAWCFKDFDNLDMSLAKSMIAGYEKNRILSNEEKLALPLLLRFACLRFLLTRSYDKIHTPKNANVVVKNPDEYLQKLKYCQTITNEDLF